MQFLKASEYMTFKLSGFIFTLVLLNEFDKLCCLIFAINYYSYYLFEKPV